MFDVSIVREGTRTSYSLRIPWAEIPGFTPVAGATMGCNVVLFDSDGGNAPGALGRMTWGAGLKPGAGDCALVTLVE